MACEYVDDDPHASEYARKGSPSDSDNDEGLYVEPNANVTKLLTTRESRNSSTMGNLEHLLHTFISRYKSYYLRSYLSIFKVLCRKW